MFVGSEKVTERERFKCTGKVSASENKIDEINFETGCFKAIS